MKTIKEVLDYSHMATDGFGNQIHDEEKLQFGIEKYCNHILQENNNKWVDIMKDLFKVVNA